MVRGVAAIVAAAIFTAPVTARPSSVARDYRHFGLFGAWAPDCSEAASPDNPHVSVSMEGHAVIEQNEFGAGFETNRYLIVAARRMSGGKLAIDALFQQGDTEPRRQLIIMHIDGKSRRTLFTGTADAPPLVKAGIAVALGKPTPVLVRCDR